MALLKAIQLRDLFSLSTVARVRSYFAHKTYRKVVAATAIAGLTAGGLIFVATSARATTILLPVFTSPTNGVTEAQNNHWVVGGTTTPTMVDGPDANSDVDRLRLVTQQGSQVAYALYDVAQTTSAGLDISFNLAMSGGGHVAGQNLGRPNDPADGIAFYIKDGNDTGNTLDSLGAKCDAIGYAPRLNGDGCRNGTTNNGLSGALLGLLFDAWGDAPLHSWDGNGCDTNAVASDDKRLVIRGPQGASRTDGYCRIATAQDEISGSNNIGIDIANTGMFASTGAAVRITIDTTDTSSGRTNGTVKVYTAAAGTSDWSGVSALSTFEIPQALAQAQTFKFGFTSGTGGSYMNGEIWGAAVSSVRDLPAPSFVTSSQQCTILNVAMSQDFVVSDGVAPYSFALTSGSLPTGLSLTSAGHLSGTPAATGTSTFTLTATDSTPGTAQTTQRTFAYTVGADECSTLSVALPDTRQVSNTSTDFNFSNQISLPGTWAASQYISAEVALTTAGTDTANVYRGVGGCTLDISSSTTSGVYGTTEGSTSTTPAAGNVTLTGASTAVWVMNDRTPAITLYGQASAVKSALSNVRASCSTLEDLVGKFVRLGAVPSEAPETIDASTVYGGLYYSFSQRHYYRWSKVSSSVTSTSYTRIGQMLGDARSKTITVDGQFINVPSSNQRHGWVITASNQDEILLSNAIAKSASSPMIGMTDVGNDSTDQGGVTNANSQTWTWDTTNWGTAPTGVSSTCVTQEGTLRWLGPDNWCGSVPFYTDRSAASGTTNTPYWYRTNGVWTPLDYSASSSASNAEINMSVINNDASTPPYNGWTTFHNWYGYQGASVSNVEPNSSGDFFYQGYGGPYWDDANPSDGAERGTRLATSSLSYYLVEYCSGSDVAHSCTPQDVQVDSIQLVGVDTSIRLNWQMNGSDPNRLDGSALDATCTNGTVTQESSSTYRTVTMVPSGNGDASCTWTPPTGVVAVDATLVGGGGGGGGDAGGGGGGGGQLVHSSFAVSGSATIVVGAGGAGRIGAAGGAYTVAGAKSGSNGGASTLTNQSVTLTANGGSGGAGCNWTGSVCKSGSIGNDGGSGGSSSGGTISVSGGNGGAGTKNSSASAVSQAGTTGGLWQVRSLNSRYGGGGAGAGSSQVASGGAGGGATSTTGTPGVGLAGRGGGGAGGNGSDGGRGGSGIVTLKYALPFATNTTSVSAQLTVVSQNSLTTSAVAKRQYTSFTDGACGSSWTTESTNITSWPDAPTLTAGRCYRWTVDAGVALGAVRPVDSTSASPTSNLTSPILFVPQVSSTLTPGVVWVDPRLNTISLPAFRTSGSAQVRLCVYESGSATLSGLGQPRATPTLTFDAGNAGSTQTTYGSTRLSGDRTDALTIEGPRDSVASTSGTLKATLTTGTFTSSRYILVRTVPIVDGVTSSCTASGASLNAQTSGVTQIEIRSLQLGGRKQVDVQIG